MSSTTIFGIGHGVGVDAGALVVGVEVATGGVAVGVPVTKMTPGVIVGVGMGVPVAVAVGLEAGAVVSRGVGSARLVQAASNNKNKPSSKGSVPFVIISLLS